MNKKEFLAALGKGLTRLSYEEQDKWLDFYSEMIDDRMEEGLTEEEAVAAIGTPKQIAEQILAQSQPVKKEKKKRELKGWQVILLIIGSPLWFSLLITAICVVFSLIVGVWSVVISLYATAVALIASGLACAILLPIFSISGAGIVGLGIGLFCIGLGILWFIGTNMVAKGTVWLCKKLFSLCLPGRRSAQ